MKSARTVLIVDDDTLTVRLLEFVLRSAGLNVLCLHDGRSALDAVREHRPDLVLADVAMPEMCGDELCRTIKDDPLTRQTLVALMSSDELAGWDTLGAVWFVRKPLDVCALGARVLEVLGGPDPPDAMAAFA